MGNRRIPDPALLQRIERVCRMRLGAEQIPSDAQLAMEAGVRRSLISRWMGAMRKAIIASGQPEVQVKSTTIVASPESK